MPDEIDGAAKNDQPVNTANEQTPGLIGRIAEKGGRIAETAKQYNLIIIHLFISVIAFVAAGLYVKYLQGQNTPIIVMPGKDSAEVNEKYLIIEIINLGVAVFATYFPLVVSVWVGSVFAGRANALMRASFYEEPSVVPQKDYGLVQAAIQSGNPAPITEYIRLVSLTGGVGIFQKIGLTGLPLVTLGLVVFFSLGVIFCKEEKTFGAFLDFTKLTLGAFIGSFVQRQVESRSRETELQRAVENITRSAPGARAQSSASQNEDVTHAPEAVHAPQPVNPNPAPAPAE